MDYRNSLVDLLFYSLPPSVLMDKPQYIAGAAADFASLHPVFRERYVADLESRFGNSKPSLSQLLIFTLLPEAVTRLPKFLPASLPEYGGHTYIQLLDCCGRSGLIDREMFQGVRAALAAINSHHLLLSLAEYWGDSKDDNLAYLVDAIADRSLNPYHRRLVLDNVLLFFPEHADLLLDLALDLAPWINPYLGSGTPSNAWRHYIRLPEFRARRIGVSRGGPNAGNLGFISASIIESTNEATPELVEAFRHAVSMCDNFQEIDSWLGILSPRFEALSRMLFRDLTHRIAKEVDPDVSYQIGVLLRKHWPHRRLQGHDRKGASNVSELAEDSLAKFASAVIPGDNRHRSAGIEKFDSITDYGKKRDWLFIFASGWARFDDVQLVLLKELRKPENEFTLQGWDLIRSASYKHMVAWALYTCDKQCIDAVLEGHKIPGPFEDFDVHELQDNFVVVRGEIEVLKSLIAIEGSGWSAKEGALFASIPPELQCWNSPGLLVARRSNIRQGLISGLCDPLIRVEISPQFLGDLFPQIGFPDFLAFSEIQRSLIIRLLNCWLPHGILTSSSATAIFDAVKLFARNPAWLDGVRMLGGL